MNAWGFIRFEIIVGLGNCAAFGIFDNCVAMKVRKGQQFLIPTSP
jgi:hypothetical protein